MSSTAAGGLPADDGSLDDTNMEQVLGAEMKRLSNIMNRKIKKQDNEFE